jgi:HEAT repeat protein
MEMQDNAQVSLILERFSSTDPDELRSAAFDAGAWGLVEAVPRLVRLLQSSNLGVQEAAEDALRTIRGPDAVRGVAPLLRSDNAAVRNSAMDILREIGEDDMKVVAGLLHDADPDMRIFGADILGTSGEHSTVSLLTEALLHDPEVNVRHQAAVSLGELGNPAVAPALRKAMADEEWVQFAVIEALTKIRADSCIDILVQALPRSSGLVASTIIDALGEMNNLKVVPLLLQQLDRASGPLRNKAVKAIVQILGARSLSLLGGKEQGKFQAYLLAALDDEDVDIIKAALLGLSGMGSPVTTQAVLNYGAKLDAGLQHDLLLGAVRSLVSMGFNEVLAKALRDPDEQIVSLAVEVCRNMSSDVAVDEVIDAFWSFNRDAQRVAMDYLAREAGERHIPFFGDILSREGIDAHVIKGALLFLGQKVRCASCGPKLLTFLQHQYDDVKETALEACIALRDSAVNAAMADMYKEQEPLLRMMAVYAMGRIGDPGYTPKLEEALEDEVPDIRKIALEALAQNQDQLFERLPLLSRRLDDESREVRLAFVDVLGNCPAEGPATELLLRALDDRDDWVRIRAIEAFGRRRMALAVPRLVEMLENSHLMVTLKIIEALGIIGDNVAFRTLLGQMGHEELEVQQAAAEAIARIREEHGEGL